MKTIWKKNQIMITALAIMIAVAGYLNFAGTKLGDEALDKETTAVSGQAVAQDYETEAKVTDAMEQLEEKYGLSGALEISDEDTEEVADIESLDEDIADVTDGEQSEVPGEAVFTAGASVEALSGAKLLKEQTRAKNKETLLDIINNTGLTEQQKQEAVDGMIRLTEVAEKEAAAEILLEAKGFTDVVVSMNGDMVDVVVGGSDLDDARRAQIEDIIQRKTGISPENIIISPVITN